MADVIIQAEL